MPILLFLTCGLIVTARAGLSEAIFCSECPGRKEDETQAETREWDYCVPMLAYGPWRRLQINTYVDPVAHAPLGRALNIARFQPFDAMMACFHRLWHGELAGQMLREELLVPKRPKRPKGPDSPLDPPQAPHKPTSRTGQSAFCRAFHHRLKGPAVRGGIEMSPMALILRKRPRGDQRTR